VTVAAAARDLSLAELLQAVLAESDEIEG